MPKNSSLFTSKSHPYFCSCFQDTCISVSTFSKWYHNVKMVDKIQTCVGGECTAWIVWIFLLVHLVDWVMSAPPCPRSHRESVCFHQTLVELACVPLASPASTTKFRLHFRSFLRAKCKHIPQWLKANTHFIYVNIKENLEIKLWKIFKRREEGNTCLTNFYRHQRRGENPVKR